MTFYLISFPGDAMSFDSAEEWAAVGESAHAVVREAKAAGVYVFGGGINEDVPPVRVHDDGTVTNDTYPQVPNLTGGFMILNLPTRDDALVWAARTAAGCRVPQEVREFMFDPES